MSRERALQARVEAVNRAHAVAKEWQPRLKAIFAPLVGKQIEKKSSFALLERVAKLVPPLPNEPYLMVYRHHSEYSLAWTVKTSAHDSDHTVLYYEVTFYVGDMRGGVLEKLHPHTFDARSDYTPEEILAKRATYRAAKQAADDARSDLWPFDPDYDR